MKKIIFFSLLILCQAGIQSCSNSDKNPDNAAQQNVPVNEEGSTYGNADSVNRNANVQGNARDSSSISSATKSGGGTGNPGNAISSGDTLKH